MTLLSPCCSVKIPNWSCSLDCKMSHSKMTFDGENDMSSESISDSPWGAIRTLSLHHVFRKKSSFRVSLGSDLESLESEMREQAKSRRKDEINPRDMEWRSIFPKTCLLCSSRLYCKRWTSEEIVLQRDLLSFRTVLGTCFLIPLTSFTPRINCLLSSSIDYNVQDWLRLVPWVMMV